MNEKIKKLVDLLEDDSKHGYYQQLAPQIVNLDASLKKFSIGRRLDDARYDWIVSKINFVDKTVIDIGANTGYFSIRLTCEKKSTIHSYEPNIKHAKAIICIKNLLSLSNKKLNIVSEIVSQESIEELPSSDVILYFNVIQHAGEDFSSSEVCDISEWRRHAVQTLKMLSGKTKYLVFQMGYTWKGHQDELVPPSSIIKYTQDLIEVSGWNILNIGVQESIFGSRYVDLSKATWQSRLLYHPNYYILSKMVGGLRRLGLINEIDIRFKQRPVFICQKK